MKRIVVVLLLLAVMLSGMMNVHASEAQITVEVRASKSEVQVGETVEYTVLATGSGVVAMQFELRLPEGLRYVPNSGATPENLAQKLGVPAADWTEISKMFTFYNDIGITFAKGTEICRFSCVAEQEGQWAPELYELLPFNEDFEEFAPGLQVQQIVVTASGSQTDPTVPEKPVAPEETTGATEPAQQPSSVPSDTRPEDIEKPTDPVTVPDEPDEEGPAPTVPEHEHISDDGPQDLPDDTVAVGALDPNGSQNLPNQEKPAKSALLWLLPLGIAAVIACGMIVFIRLKKKAP